MLDKDVGDRGKNADLERIGRSIVDAVLDRPERGRGADIPAHLVETLDDAGADHVLGVCLQVLPRVELTGDTRRGQLLEDHRPVGGVAGVLARPEGGGGRQRLQVPEVGGERGLDGQDLRAVLDTDVDVDPVQQHLVSPVGGAFDELSVSVRVRDPLSARAGEGVGPGRGQVDAQVGCQGREEINAVREIGEALGDRGTRLGDDLDGVEQHLPMDAGVELSMSRGPVDDGVGALAQVVGVTIHELELPLHSDR